MNASIRAQVSETEKLTHPLRLAFPIQSAAQLVSALFTVAIAWIILLGLGKFIFHESPPKGLWIGMLLGGLPAIWAVLPSRVFVAVDGAIGKRAVIDFIRHKGYRYGLKKETVVDSQIQLSPSWPRFLVWQENTVKIEEVAQGVNITGPSAAIALLSKADRKALSPPS